MNEGMGSGQPQLELPQVSFARYLDLLKRRKWQVIPVSLLGLLIGGLVAFFIPRYYVASTRLEHSRAPDQSTEALTGRQDPFRQIVDSAIHTIPLAVIETMRALGWEEGLERDPFQLQENARAVRSRLDVLDVNPGRDRDYAQLVVSYKDRQGQRAAEFLNTLVRTWVDERLQQMRERAEAARTKANDRLRKAIGEYDQINRDLYQLAVQYGFQREYSEAAQREVARSRELERQGKEARLVETTELVARLERELEALQQQLDQTPRTGGASPQTLNELFPEGSPQRLMYLELITLQRSLEVAMGPAHPERAATERRVAQLRQQLDELLGGDEGVNPTIARLREQILAKEAELATAAARKGLLTEELARDAERQQRREAAYAEFVEKDRLLTEAEQKRDAAQQTLDAANDMISELDLRQPIKIVVPAVVPQRPTDPNVFLVAGIGAVLGLGIAIGLILLLDTLQGTFKTVEDVERALPVPVLGGLSHLETVEQRVRTATGRRRASLLAAAVLVCGVVVVTVYYVAPERLPPFARDLLTMVLGD